MTGGGHEQTFVPLHGAAATRSEAPGQQQARSRNRADYFAHAGRARTVSIAPRECRSTRMCRCALERRSLIEIASSTRKPACVGLSQLAMLLLCEKAEELRRCHNQSVRMCGVAHWIQSSKTGAASIWLVRNACGDSQQLRCEPELRSHRYADGPSTDNLEDR